MLAGFYDRISENDSIVEMKCPIREWMYTNYVKNGKPTEKFCVLMQLQLYLAGLRKGHFCVVLTNNMHLW